MLSLLLSPLVWLPIVGILGYLTYKNHKKINRLKVLNVDSVLLMLEIPRANDKKELAAEQLFASLHGILRDADELKESSGVQEHLGFEIVSTAGQIRFYVWVPKSLQNFVEGQIYAQYPTVQIHVAKEDYTESRHNKPVVYSSEITLTDDEALPIKTFETFDVDPLAGITGTLAKLDPNHSEELWIQILVRPIPDDWHKTTDEWISEAKSGRKPIQIAGIDFSWFAQLITALWKPPEGGSGSETSAPELSERTKTRIAEAEKKATKLGYQVKIRLAYLGNSDINARLNMQALVGTFKQFNSTNLNGFKQLGGSFNSSDLEAYKLRQFTDDGFILNISELASVYHLPHTSVETPNIVWATSKTAEPPAQLPLVTGSPEDKEVSAFGLTNFRGINHQFGILRKDRSRHVYIIGQTGAGKSGLLELFALSDVYYNQGYCIIDPHGDFAVNNLRFVPERRIRDVVYFNPADTEHPVAFNPLEITDGTRKPNISSEVIGVLKRMFGDSWGPRLEHILRYTLLALLDRPSTTLLDISRMLTDKDFRKETLDYCQDVTVLQFWKHEFGQWSEKQVNESIAPVLNKVGAFTANPIIRNIIGQPKSSFNVRKIMDEGKILVVNLSKGLVGEDNAGILGAFLVTKVQLAAMSRSDIPNVADRRPFYLYVDEFQNFATDSFAVILSEARKYGLNLVVANQYIAQMTDSVREAVFGNVGTTISFRVAPEDASTLVKQFEPTFDEADLVQMNNRNFIISMIINGEKVPAFSATTLNLPSTPMDNLDLIVNASRAQYSRPREEVEREIRDTIEQAEKYKRELSDSGRAAGEQGITPQFSFKPLDLSAKPTPSAYPNTPTSDNRQPYSPNRPNFKAPKNRTKTELKHPQNYSELKQAPEYQFKKLKLSPNTAEEKTNRPGLKDLGRIIAEHQNTIDDTQDTNAIPSQQGSITSSATPTMENTPNSPSHAPIATPKTSNPSQPIQNQSNSSKKHNRKRHQKPQNTPKSPNRPDTQPTPKHHPERASAPQKPTQSTPATPSSPNQNNLHNIRTGMPGETFINLRDINRQ